MHVTLAGVVDKLRTRSLGTPFSLGFGLDRFTATFSIKWSDEDALGGKALEATRADCDLAAVFRCFPAVVLLMVRRLFEAYVFLPSHGLRALSCAGRLVLVGSMPIRHLSWGECCEVLRFMGRTPIPAEGSLVSMGLLP